MGFLVLAALGLGGCDRLECDVVHNPYCTNAVVCCPMIKDDVTGDCYVETVGPEPLMWPCRGANCDDAIESWSKRECNYPDLDLPQTQTGEKP